MKMSPLILAAVIALSPFAATLADPPPHAPAHGYRAKHYRYVYYPEREVYYRPDDGIWFWLSGGNWEFGARLPAGYQPYSSGGVTLELDTDRPYTEHRYVVQKYGKGPKNNDKDGPGKSQAKGAKHKD